MALGDNLPAPNKQAGMAGHIADHNAIVQEVADTQALLLETTENGPAIKGTVNDESDLANIASPRTGDMYLVGESGLVYSYYSSAWHNVGEIQGPQGPAGQSGTIVGILAAGENPPAGTAAGTLWYTDEEVTIPVDYAPTYVGSSAVCSTSSSSNMTMTWPVGPINQDDLAVMCIAYNAADNLSTPSGWTEVSGAGNSTYTQVNLKTTLLYRFCTASESSFVITTTNAASGTQGARKAATMMVFRNVGAEGVVLRGTSLMGGTAVNTLAAATVTPTVDSFLCGFWAERQGTSVAYLPSSFDTPTYFDAVANVSGPSSLNGIVTTVQNAQPSIFGGYSLNIPTTGAAAPSGTQTWTRPTSGSPVTSTMALTVAIRKAHA